MVQESKLLETPVAEDQQDNLVELKQNKKKEKEAQVLEINKQMSALEDSVEKLNKKLNTTNRSIKKEVERLNTSDADITEKVADTYKQLGAIEGTFKELNSQSSKINDDIKKVNNSVSKLQKSSAAALKQAIDNQNEINAEFRQTHEEIISRAEKLTKKAGSISTKLNKSIKENSRALTQLEAKIVVELENIAQTSEQRDQQLEEKIESANDEISSQKAKMLLMQSVDEALQKRAEALEKTTEKLLTGSDALKDATEMLNVLTARLSADVDALEVHTAALAAENKEQQGFIEQLQEKTSSLAQDLLALANLERKHFRGLLASSLILLLAVIAVFIYGETMRGNEQVLEAQRNNLVNEQVGDLQNRVEDEQMASQVFYEEIAKLQNNIVGIKQEMQGMNDQVESLDGRVQYLAPLYNFGTDNTIHGTHWLQQLKPEQFSIMIATVADKQELYEIAQRYNRYFDQELAYFITADQEYALVYGGQFDSEEQINSLMRRMPRFINHQRISAIPNSEILQQLKS